ncbi:MAG TPA: membrane protein insertase YidC [Aquabacterium sp.]|nr:membrane protein insertase YidC [Aquabacterium sp.]
MNDLRRTILWSVFAFSLLMLWDGYLRHTGQPSMFSPGPAAADVAADAASAASAAVANGSAAVPLATAGAGALPPAAASAASGVSAPAVPPREQVLIETDTVRATLDTLGGNLVKLELLKHTDQDNTAKPVLLLEQSAVHTYLAQSGLVSATGALPDHTTPMTVLTSERKLADGQNALVVKLESAVVGGVKRVLTYSFPRGGYVVDVKQEVVNTTAAAIKPQLYLQLQRDGTVPEASGFFGAPTSYTGPAFYTDEAKFQKVEFAEIEEGKAEFAKSANNGWVSVVQHYFASAWLHKAPDSREFFARKVGPNLYTVGMLFTVGEVAAGQTKAFESQLFVGPQEEKKLEEIAPGLELVKDYGIVTILAKPLFWLLHLIHSVLQNWGWSIVALVVFLKGIFYWLNASAYRSMAKMKAINPKIQEMRERLKDNPQEMQQQMLKIYREEKVNPIGGCLPIVIQIPVFIALYWVLLSSVEIRQAPWLGWITDLSLKDPYYVLPALMTVSTMVQTWLNPTPPDPLQAKMMWIMPLVFSVMFFFFPAGLVLYWLTNNILSIAQQWMINRSIEGATAK